MSGRNRESPEAVGAAEEIRFLGHAMVRAVHGTTIEITTEGHLTEEGDCIVGVRAAKGVAQLSSATKEALKRSGAKVRFTIVAPGGEFSFLARGSEDLSFESETDIVIRTSRYVCGRTVAIEAESSARGIPRELVRTLKSPTAAGLLRIEVYS
jgi:hypothetical protein